MQNALITSPREVLKRGGAPSIEQIQELSVRFAHFAVHRANHEPT
jgi:hypothetical protein